MALTRTHLITLWKDGMVRWIGVDDGLAIERLATTFQPSAGVTPKALSAIAIGPKFDMAIVGTEDGSLHDFRVVSVDADAEAEVTVPHILPLLYVERALLLLLLLVLLLPLGCATAAPAFLHSSVTTPALLLRYDY